MERSENPIKWKSRISDAAFEVLMPTHPCYLWQPATAVLSPSFPGISSLIDKLELLLALAKERHFGRAAEACGVTQPTMSTSLKQLEEILGVMLVQRGSRFQGFTPEGERTLDWARRIVGDTRAMRQEINSLKDKLSGEIRLAAIPTVLGMVAQLTTPFRARYPDVRFRIQSCTSADVLGLL
jgi:DNA-binding transcriptional LysR family regulator